MFGRLVESVTSALDLNIATLSGCVDIIVVPQKSGELKSTPFHVRFGKAKLLRSREKEVFIIVNGQQTNLRMYLGTAGEAYFREIVEPKEDFRMRSAPPETLFSKTSEFVENLDAHKQKSVQLNSGRLSRSISPSPEPMLSITQKQFESNSLEFSFCAHLLTHDPLLIKNDLNVFNEHLLTWEDFNRNPMFWYHPMVMCRFDSQPPMFPCHVALPLLASWVSFNRALSIDALKSLMSTKIQAHQPNDKTLINWMFGNTFEVTSQTPQTEMDALLHNNVPIDALSGSTAQDTPTVNRVLRPTSQQLAELKLNPGVNSIEFCVSSSLQGVKSVKGFIYLWPNNSKIIVSDVDGTITKSDVLGQLMPIVGKDWSHRGVAELFSKCRDNNYNILYLTSRAIGQADSTRDYLFGLRQNDFARLPDGPLIMSPDRLFLSFKREVIERKPYLFKIAALQDVRNLYPKQYNPFYAGFGNRDTDYRAYVHIGIPESRVFIIEPSGIIHHCNKTMAKTYESLSEITEHMFPYIDPNREIDLDEQFNDLNYWRPNEYSIDYDKGATYDPLYELELEGELTRLSLH